MPSLADTLAQLAHQSEEISRLSSYNTRPPGPFVQAYLQVSINPAKVLSHRPTTTRHATELIRDSDESERRLFKFIGEDKGSVGGTGGVKRIEKREGGVVTPLKELRKGRHGDGAAREGDEIEVILRTAGRLVDDYHPMPRARAHINELLRAHNQRQERLADLERQVAELTDLAAKPTIPQAEPAHPLTSNRPTLSVDEAIKAEEDALKALEAEVAPLRRSAFAKSAAAPSNDHTPPASPSQSPEKGGSTQVVALSTSTNARTPAKTPHVTNSLVNNMTTPHRQAPATANRFSPLRFLGTPRTTTKSGLKSAIRPSHSAFDDDEAPRPIFGRASLIRSTNSTAARAAAMTPKAVADDGDDDEAPQAGQDDTIRLAPPIPVSETSPSKPQSTPDRPSSMMAVSPEATPKVSSPLRSQITSSPREKGPRKVEGVAIELEGVRLAVAKIWSTVGEMMTQGLAPGVTLEQTPGATVQHLYKLSKSDPDPPPSPSTASSMSSLSSAAVSTMKAPPIIPSTILQAHLCLMLLRALSPSNPDGSVAMNEARENMTAVAKARGWEVGNGGELSTKVVYAAAGRRVLKIERKAGPARLRFAD